MKIVLTGFMGAGKTSVGRELSRMLGYPFVDTDVLIEEREGMPIALIFRERGEEYFRRVERSVVQEVSGMVDAVIATGGGVIKDRGNVRNLSRRGVLVWLRAEPKIILRRVMSEGGTRPLLNVKEPLKEIMKLLSGREGLYMKSDMAVDTDYITPGEAAEEIIEKLGLHLDKVTVDLGDRSYDILIGRKVLALTGARLKEFRPSKVAIISNTTVFSIYGDEMLSSMKEYGFTPEVLLIPDGEEYKNMLWTYILHGRLLKSRFDRDALLVALGGGVVGDITGFVASTYMRGIRYVQVPTTLLSQVDSSVGGKTGVNHTLGKNMIGTFYQPSLVMIDIDTLRTLPAREFGAGIAEVIKYGVISDRTLFDYLKDNRDAIVALNDGVIPMIRRSCEIKADVVSRDEKEAGLRAILNFGHTIGHAVETVTGYRRFLHGEAVAMGMSAAADLALQMGIFREEDAQKLKKLLRMYDLQPHIPEDLDAGSLVRAMEVDKKVRAGSLRFILPEEIGRVRIEDGVDRDLIRGVLS
jgi:3-dehydroquinate synthase